MTVWKTTIALTCFQKSQNLRFLKTGYLAIKTLILPFCLCIKYSHSESPYIIIKLCVLKNYYNSWSNFWDKMLNFQKIQEMIQSFEKSPPLPHFSLPYQFWLKLKFCFHNPKTSPTTLVWEEEGIFHWKLGF